jgi:competence protein ComEC
LKNYLLERSRIKRVLLKSRNQYLLPVIASVCLFYGWRSKLILLVILSIFYLVNFCYRKQFFLIGLFLLFSTVFVVRELVLDPTPVQVEQAQTMTINVAADTIVVNGDLVKFDGWYNGQSIKCTYQLASLTERDSWSLRMNWHRQLKVRGEFVSISKKTNQYAFDYQAYLFANRYLGQFQIDEIEQTRPLPFDFRAFAHGLRSWAVARVEQRIDPKIGYLINGLLFGFRQVAFYDELSPFTQNGLLHLFSISGMHVYFFLGWVDWFFRRIGASFQYQIVPFFLCAFILTCFFGISSSILRAIFMYLLYWIGKESSIHLSSMDRYALVLAVCIVIEPRTLLQLSSQLSFAFSFFLLFMQQQPEKNWQKFLYAQMIPLLSAPLLMYLFFEWPLLSGVFTFIFMPIFDLVMLPLATFLFLFCPFSHIASILEYLLIMIMKISRFLLTNFPKMVLPSGQPPLLLVLCCTILAIWCLGKKNYLIFVVSCLLLPLIPRMVSPSEKVTFIDIGQGDCIVLQTKWNHEVYVID